MLKKCRIIPKVGIPDILKLQRIEYPCEIVLNEREIRRAVSFATVYEILEDGSEVLLDEYNFDDVHETTEEPQPPIIDDPDISYVIGLEEGVTTVDVAGLNTGGIDKIRIYE